MIRLWLAVLVLVFSFSSNGLPFFGRWGIASAQDYQIPQVKALDNGLRYVISETSDPTGQVSIELFQVISANDENPGEEGMLTLYRLIPSEVLGAASAVIPADQGLALAIGHGDFGLEPSVRAEWTMKNWVPDQYAALLGDVAGYASLTEPSGDMIAAAFEGLARARTARINKKVVFTTETGSSRRFSIGGPQRLADAQRDAFLHDRVLSLPKDGSPPTRRDMVAFLRRSLSPARTIVVITGPVDRPALEAALRDSFGRWRAHPSAVPAVEQVTVPQGDQLHIQTSDDETSFARFQIAPDALSFAPQDRLDRTQRALRSAVGGYVNTLLNETLEAGGYRGKKPLLFAPLSAGPGFSLNPRISKLTASSATIAPALDLLARLKRYGLPENALPVIRRAVLQRLGESVAASTKELDSPKDIVVGKGRGLTVLAQSGIHSRYIDRWSRLWGSGDIRRAKGGTIDGRAVADRLTLARANDILRGILSGNQIKVITVGPTDETALLDAARPRWAELASADLEPLKGAVGPTLDYTDFGPPGRVVNREEFPALKSWKFTFANNVVLLYRHSPELGTRARFAVGVTDPGSIDSLDAGKIHYVLELATHKLALGRHNSDEILEFRNSLPSLSGQSTGRGMVQLAADIGADKLDIDVYPALRYAAARLSDTVYDRKVMQDVLDDLINNDGQFNITPAQVRTVLPSALGGVERSQASRRDFKSGDVPTLDQLMAAQRDMMENQAVRVVYAGSESAETVIDRVARTLGALKKRRPFGAAPMRPAPVPLQSGAIVDAQIAPDEQGRIPGIAAYLPMPRSEDPTAFIRQELLTAVLLQITRRSFLDAGLSTGDLYVYHQPRPNHAGGDHIRVTYHGDPGQLAGGRDVLSVLFAAPLEISAQDVERARIRLLEDYRFYDGWSVFEADLLHRYGYSRSPAILPADKAEIAAAMTVESMRAVAEDLVKPGAAMLVRFGWK